MNGIAAWFLKRETMNFLKKHWAQISVLLGGAITFLTPSLSTYADAHHGTVAAVMIAALLDVLKKEGTPKQ